MNYERGGADRDKSPGHYIAWGNQYSGMTERFYTDGSKNTKELLAASQTKDYTVYSHSLMVAAINAAILAARLEEIDNAIRMAKHFYPENVEELLRERRAEVGLRSNDALAAHVPHPGGST